RSRRPAPGSRSDRGHRLAPARSRPLPSLVPSSPDRRSFLEGHRAADHDVVDDGDDGPVGRRVAAGVGDAGGTPLSDEDDLVLPGTDEVDGQVGGSGVTAAGIGGVDVAHEQDLEPVETRFLDRGDDLPDHSSQLHRRALPRRRPFSGLAPNGTAWLVACRWLPATRSWAASYRRSRLVPAPPAGRMSR